MRGRRSPVVLCVARCDGFQDGVGVAVPKEARRGALVEGRSEE
jgi:hypothetical protein